jgi:phosphate starvation-inducible PhoH-like protein
LKEITIPVGINPVGFYGVNDANLEILRKKFPGLKLISRGTELKILGDKAQVSQLQEKMDVLLALYEKHGHLDERTFTEVLDGPIQPEEPGEVRKQGDAIVFGPNGLVVRARTPGQMKLVEASFKNDIVFAIGPAGTGKTYTAVALAVRALRNREVRRIVLTRPAVEAGENLGFLPGDLKEKIDPYLRPLYDALFDMIPGEKLRSFLENGVIEVAPLAFMRGRTLDNAYVILDEAQNTTRSQLKMFLTRMGPSAKFILTGDITQIDLPKNQPSGLIQGLDLLKSVKGIGLVFLDSRDVVRHKLVKDIIEAYSEGEKKEQA